jgi:DNA primase
MGILAEDVARVRAASDLVAIASEHIGLKRVGRRYTGLCPFHAEKTPSFSVNPTEGLYYCFGCGAKGDVITFVREVEHLEFAEAVERLAGRAGIQLRYDEVSAAASAERKRMAALREAMARAVEWYHQRLLSSPDAAPARHYLRERGYDGEVVRAYRLGWAPDGWDALAQALRLPDDVLRDTGLGFVNARGRQQDGFRARVLFPIFDPKGEPLALGGRTLPGGPPPKYRNSPETPLYKKSRVLYGLNWAKGAIVAAGEVVVCEGYTDVIGLHRAGVGHAVATCGTALAEEHVQLLRSFAPRLVLAYDADAAGQAAAERVYEWERRFDIDVAVAALPAGHDPADLAQRDPAALRAAVAEARPFLQFRLERVLDGADVRSPEGRARAAEAALGVIGQHPNELVRDQYVMQVADRTGIDPDRLRSRLRKGPAGGRGASGGDVLVAPPRLHPAELEVLRAAVHRPEDVAERLHRALFEPGVGRRAYDVLSNAETLHDAIAAADPATADLIQRLAVEEFEGDPDVHVRALVGAAGRRALRRLEAGGRTAEIAWVKPAIEELAETATAPGATARLVPWLVRLEEEDR